MSLTSHPTARIIIALSGGVDSAVAGNFMKSCVHTVADLIALQTTSAQYYDNSRKKNSLESVAQHIRSGTPWKSVVDAEPLAPHPVLGDCARRISYLPVFMRNWEGDGDTSDRGWCEKSLKEFHDATTVARESGLIESREGLKELNFSAEYSLACFDPMLEAFCRGETLNADILCNTEIKFGALWKYCQEIYGAEALVTGHYARSLIVPSGDVLLARPRTAGNDLNDQTVFLSRLSPSQIARGVFPLGHVFERKEDVRCVARLLGLESVATKKTSTGLCFVSPKLGGCVDGCKTNFSAFLDEYTRNDDSRRSVEGGVPEVTRFFMVDDGDGGCGGGTAVEVSVKHRYGDSCRLPAYALTVGEKVQAYVPADEKGKRKKETTRSEHPKSVLRTLYVRSKNIRVDDSRESGTAVVQYLSRVELVSRWDHHSLYTQRIVMQHISFAVSVELLLRYGVMVAQREVEVHAPTGLRYEEPGGSGTWYTLTCFCCCRHQEPLRASVAHIFVPCCASDSLGCNGWVEVSEPVRAATPGQAVVMYVSETAFESHTGIGNLSHENGTAEPHKVGNDVENRSRFVVVASGWISSQS